MAEVRASSVGQLFQMPGSEQDKARAGCPRLCPVGFLLSPRMENPRTLWTTCLVFNYPHVKQIFFFDVHRIFCISVFACSLLFCHGVCWISAALALSSLLPPINYFSVLLRYMPETSPGWTVPDPLFLGLFIILVTLHWAHSNICMSLLERQRTCLFWVAHDWSHHCRCVSPELSRAEGWPPSTC